MVAAGGGPPSSSTVHLYSPVPHGSGAGADRRTPSVSTRARGMRSPGWAAVRKALTSRRCASGSTGRGRRLPARRSYARKTARSTASCRSATLTGRVIRRLRQPGAGAGLLASASGLDDIDGQPDRRRPEQCRRVEHERPVRSLPPHPYPKITPGCGRSRPAEAVGGFVVVPWSARGGSATHPDRTLRGRAHPDDEGPLPSAVRVGLSHGAALFSQKVESAFSGIRADVPARDQPT